MNIYNLIIETTRQCNLQCDHCLRGAAQNKVIDSKYLDSIFSQISYVSTISITGGEPALHPEKIIEIIETAKKYSVTIDSFYIATNCTISSDDFIKSLIELYHYCDTNEVSQVDLSNDAYHWIDDNVRAKLSCLRFVGNKFKEDTYNYEHHYGGEWSTNLLNEGNAIDNFSTTQNVELEEVEIDGNTIEQLYLNCEGNLIKGCNWSYDSQEEDEKIYCHVDKLTALQCKIA